MTLQLGLNNEVEVRSSQRGNRQTHTQTKQMTTTTLAHVLQAPRVTKTLHMELTR